MDAEARRSMAVEFLRIAANGDPRPVRDRFFTPDAKHHNAWTPAGITALTEAMAQNSVDRPDKRFEIRHVLADGDLVAVHSHLRMQPGDQGMAVVHLFRFEGDKIAEFWDVAQPLPKDFPNGDGMF